MIGILIVAHGAFGEALIHCASHVLGKRPLRVRQLGVTVHDDPDAILPQAQDLVRQLDDGEGVLVLTDMLGATPSNIAARLLVAGQGRGRRGREPADADPRAHLPRRSRSRPWSTRRSAAAARAWCTSSGDWEPHAATGS